MECEHGSDPASCPPCRAARRGVRDRRVARVGYAMAARFAGQCPECDLPIRVGDLIRRVTTGDDYETVDRYVHDGCAP